MQETSLVSADNIKEEKKTLDSGVKFEHLETHGEDIEMEWKWGQQTGSISHQTQHVIGKFQIYRNLPILEKQHKDVHAFESWTTQLVSLGV